MDWYQLPEDLAPGDYTLAPDGSLYGYPIRVGGTVELGEPPALAAMVRGEIAAGSPGECSEELRLCFDLDVGAPGVDGWTIEVSSGGSRTWWTLPAAGLQEEGCLRVSCQPADEVCAEFRTVDPTHARVDGTGTLCAPIEPAPSADTGTSAGTGTGAGLGCATSPGPGISGWVLVAAGGLAVGLVLASRR
jgi:hypothetical protein